MSGAGVKQVATDVLLTLHARKIKGSNLCRIVPRSVFKTGPLPLWQSSIKSGGQRNRTVAGYSPEHLSRMPQQTNICLSSVKHERSRFLTCNPVRDPAISFTGTVLYFTFIFVLLAGLEPACCKQGCLKPSCMPIPSQKKSFFYDIKNRLENAALQGYR